MDVGQLKKGSLKDREEDIMTRVVMILIKFKSRQSVVAFPLCVFLFLMVDAIKRSGVCWVLYLGPSGFSQLAPIKPHPGIFQGQS